MKRGRVSKFEKNNKTGQRRKNLLNLLVEV